VVAAALAMAMLAGCGFTRRLTVGAMVPVLENTVAAARERSDLGTVGLGFPANLLLVDGLIRTSPRDARLLALGSYLYFGYALGWVESSDPDLASQYYRTGRDYGLRALDRHATFRTGRAGSVDAFARGLKSVGKRDVPALAWAVANWARWLSLNLDSPAAIADMPRIEAALERLLVLEPGFEGGLPHALRGAYDALRPEMFGGNPQRAREHLETALRLSNRRSLLYLVFYAEFYCRQVLDEDCFTTTLQEVEAAPDSGAADTRLLNAIGRERARVLRARQAELF
jgi:hypothetical protein